MRTALGIAALSVALGSFAAPAHAGCVDDYLQGNDYLAPDQNTVTFNPDGSVTVQPNAAVPDALRVAGFGIGVASNEAGRVVALVNCIK